MEENKISLIDEDGNEEEFYVIEETRLNGINYVLVTDAAADADEADAYIMKDVSAPEDEEATYEFLEEGEELEALGEIFAELLDEDETDLVR